MPNLVKRLHRPPAWSRPPWVPLAYLLVVALPLSIWRSPGADPRATALLVASFALLLLVSATGQSHAVAWARAYLALGVVLALFHGRFRANELAGVMLLFLPLAAVLAAGHGLTRARRLQAAVLALVFGGTLVGAGSRGGVLAAVVTGLAVLTMERRWRLLALALVAAGLLATPGTIDWLVHDGKVQGVTLDSLLTGRPEIWRRSLHAAADFAWTGVGVGAYDHVVPALYFPAGAEHLEDAHSLPIQTALDLGAGGLLAMAALVLVASRRAWRAWRRAPAGGPRRAWALGLFASLLAFCVFNLFDAVALGTAGGLAFFMLLGLIYALLGPPRRRRLPVRLALGAFLVLVGLASVFGVRQLNHAAVLAARALVHDPRLLPPAHAALDAARSRVCRAGWLQGKVAQAWQRPDLRDAAWAGLLRCDAAFVSMIADELPDHRSLAELAVARRPSSADAHLWLARIRRRSDDRDGAERLYRRCLELEPGNGQAWLELGQLLAPDDPRAALAAYAESCRRGDPGANGCLAAGATAERLGDPETAIRFYRKSRFGRARERAEQLAGGQP